MAHLGGDPQLGCPPEGRPHQVPGIANASLRADEMADIYLANENAIFDVTGEGVRVCMS